MVDEIPQTYMIKSWRKKFLEKSRQFKRFVEQAPCSTFELDDLTGEVEQRRDEPLVSVNGTLSAFDQYQAALADDG